MSSANKNPVQSPSASPSIGPITRIVAYHVEIVVEDEVGALWAIRADLEDWFSDEEVLEMLAEDTGQKTLGEIIKAIGEKKSIEEKKAAQASDNIPSARIVKLRGASVRQKRNWDEKITEKPTS